MRRSVQRTRLLYYGFPLAGAFVVVSVLLFGSTSRIVNAAMIVGGVLVVGEGIALLVNWRAGAEEFLLRLHSDPRSPLGHLPRWLIRGVFGGGMIALGLIVVLQALRYM